METKQLKKLKMLECEIKLTIQTITYRNFILMDHLSVVTRMRIINTVA